MIKIAHLQWQLWSRWITVFLIAFTCMVAGCTSEPRLPLNEAYGTPIAGALAPTMSMDDRGVLTYGRAQADSLPVYVRHLWQINANSKDEVRVQLQANGWVPFWTVSGSAASTDILGTGDFEFIATTGGVYQVEIMERYGGGSYELTSILMNPPTATPQPLPTALPPTAVVDLGTGDVQITLRWSTHTDLDLHVFDPSGFEISFASPRSPTGGQLDVDANYQPCAETLTPVENVFWQTGGSPRGQFRVEVHYHPTCGEYGSTPYEITVNVTGQPPQIRTGTLSYNQTDEVITFSF